MEGYSERAHQEVIKGRLRSRGNGFRSFELLGSETIAGMHSHRTSQPASPERLALPGQQLIYVDDL